MSKRKRYKPKPKFKAKEALEAPMGSGSAKPE